MVVEYPLSLFLCANSISKGYDGEHVTLTPPSSDCRHNADMSSSASLESILLQAGGLNVTLHSQNNSLIPQDVVESTTAVLHEIAQLLASGPNILLPVEYRQAQYDIDLCKLVVSRIDSIHLLNPSN